MAAAPLRTEPEIQVEGCRILDHVATFAVPSWFIDYVCGVELQDISIQEAPHNFISILCFCFDASYHSLDTVVNLGKAHRHHSAESAGHILVAFVIKTRDAEAFLSTAELDSVERDDNAKCLASAGEAFVPIDDGGHVKFVWDETCRECSGFENRLLLWAKAVVLGVVPALADDAMETYDFIVNIWVGEANISEIIHSQGEVLMQAIGATVVLVG